MNEWTGREVDNIIQGIAVIGMKGNTELLEKLRPGLEECNAKIEDILSIGWYNKEMAKLYRENHKPDIEAIK